MNVLPAPTRSKLRSTQILTSLPQVIAELVQNSLDAGARHVQVGVDAQNWSCWVKDDGCGMSREDMQTLAQGLEDRRYCEYSTHDGISTLCSYHKATSKVYSQYSLNEVEGFGFRGEGASSTRATVGMPG
jgi:DNA mismatch repair protein MLH3